MRLDEAVDLESPDLEDPGFRPPASAEANKHRGAELRANAELVADEQQQKRRREIDERVERVKRLAETLRPVRAQVDRELRELKACQVGSVRPQDFDRIRARTGTRRRGAGRPGGARRRTVRSCARSGSSGDPPGLADDDPEPGPGFGLTFAGARR